MSIPTTLFRSKEKSAKTRHGNVEVSYYSLHFSSDDNEYVVTLPFIDITEIVKESSHTIKIQLKEKQSKPIYMKLDHNDTASLISQLFTCTVKIQDENQTNLYLSDSPMDHDPHWIEKQDFFSTFMDPAYEKQSLLQWNHYFNFFGRGSTVIRTRALFDLILSGIPTTLRRTIILFLFFWVFFNFFSAMMWQIVSGSYYNSINDNLTYVDYLNRALKSLEQRTLGKSVEFNEYYDEIVKVWIPSLSVLFFLLFYQQLILIHSFLLFRMLIEVFLNILFMILQNLLLVYKK